MAIITISRGSYSKGREVAEKVAQRMGYQVVSRDVLLEASEKFHIPEVKLVRAIHDAPSILERFTHGKYCYLAFIRAALSERAVKDDLVYHGLAGHLLLKGVPHVLKVRIIADLEARVAAEMKRENLTQNQACSLLIKDDAERRKWTQSLYGVDPWDASLYDLVIHINQLTVDDAVDFIVQAAGRECFKTTVEAQQKMQDLALACRVKASLAEDDCVDIAVTSEFGNVLVYTKQDARKLHRMEDKLKLLTKKVPEINHLEVRSGQAFPPEAC